jgi:hypothetical protein
MQILYTMSILNFDIIDVLALTVCIAHKIYLQLLFWATYSNLLQAYIH